MKALAWSVCVFIVSTPLYARERLGVYQGWAAFRDAEATRCYAIAAPEETLRRPMQPAFFSVGFWPKRSVAHQIYVRISRNRSPNSGVTLSAGGRRFKLKASGATAWATDRRMDLAILAAMRSATSLTIETIGDDRKSIVDAYSLRGAPSAIDAAALECSQIKG